MKIIESVEKLVEEHPLKSIFGWLFLSILVGSGTSMHIDRILHKPTVIRCIKSDKELIARINEIDPNGTARKYAELSDKAMLNPRYFIKVPSKIEGDNLVRDYSNRISIDYAGLVKLGELDSDKKIRERASKIKELNSSIIKYKDDIIKYRILGFVGGFLGSFILGNMFLVYSNFKYKYLIKTKSEKKFKVIKNKAVT